MIQILYQIIDIFIILLMGNTNHLQDKVLLKNLEKVHHQFKNNDILFDAKDVKFPLSTKGPMIVDKTGTRVKLAGANWSGGHMERHCVSGLQYRHIDSLCEEIVTKFDMNCIRLTFSLEMFYKNNIINSKFVKANPQFIGKTSMQIFDETIKCLTKHGLMVILNNHTSSSQWCCSPWDGDGLWWSQKYDQKMYFNCLLSMAKRYKDNPLVIGMDLRNQLRRLSNLTAPTWGDKNPKTDWHQAAQYIGNQIHKICPDWLILVSGLDYQLDLTGVAQYPINLVVPNKLIYTGHFYGFSWIMYSWTINSYSDFYKKMFNEQLFVRAKGVPYFLGEFGNNQCDIPWVYLMQLLEETDIDWTYWCLDGFKCDYEDQSFGIWNKDFSAVRNPEMLKQIKKVGRPRKK